MAEFTSADVIKFLRLSRTRPSTLRPPARPGLYAIFPREAGGVGWIGMEPDRPLFVGKSKDLQQREFDTHFAVGHSGFSTLRRSLGAILRQELDLQCWPRSPGPSETNVTNFKFDPAGEQRLTLWMAENLELGICPLDQPIQELEKVVIVEMEPVLNLIGWPNPRRAALRELRADCKREAQGRR